MKLMSLFIIQLIVLAVGVFGAEDTVVTEESPVIDSSEPASGRPDWFKYGTFTDVHAICYAVCNPDDNGLGSIGGSGDGGSGDSELFQEDDGELIDGMRRDVRKDAKTPLTAADPRFWGTTTKNLMGRRRLSWPNFGSSWNKSPISTQETSGKCQDTPGWTNPNYNNWTCDRYEASSYCSGGTYATPASAAQNNYPDRNCCACGKKGTQTAEKKRYIIGTSDACPLGYVGVTDLSVCQNEARNALGKGWLRAALSEDGMCTFIAEDGPNKGDRNKLFYGSVGVANTVTGKPNNRLHHKFVCVDSTKRVKFDDFDASSGSGGMICPCSLYTDDSALYCEQYQYDEEKCNAAKCCDYNKEDSSCSSNDKFGCDNANYGSCADDLMKVWGEVGNDHSVLLSEIQQEIASDTDNWERAVEALQEDNDYLKEEIEEILQDESDAYYKAQRAGAELAKMEMKEEMRQTAAENKKLLRANLKKEAANEKMKGELVVMGETVQGMEEEMVVKEGTIKEMEGTVGAMEAEINAKKELIELMEGQVDQMEIAKQAYVEELLRVKGENLEMKEATRETEAESCLSYVKGSLQDIMGELYGPVAPSDATAAYFELDVTEFWAAIQTAATTCGAVGDWDFAVNTEPSMFAFYSTACFVVDTESQSWACVNFKANLKRWGLACPQPSTTANIGDLLEFAASEDAKQCVRDSFVAAMKPYSDEYGQEEPIKFKQIKKGSGDDKTDKYCDACEAAGGAYHANSETGSTTCLEGCVMNDDWECTPYGQCPATCTAAALPEGYSYIGTAKVQDGEKIWVKDLACGEGYVSAKAKGVDMRVACSQGEAWTVSGNIGGCRVDPCVNNEFVGLTGKERQKQNQAGGAVKQAKLSIKKYKRMVEQVAQGQWSLKTQKKIDMIDIVTLKALMTRWNAAPKC